MKDWFVSLSQAMIVERSPIRNISFNFFIYSIQQPSRYTLYIPLSYSSAPTMKETEGKSPRRTDKTSGAGIQCTNNSYNIPLTSNNLAGVCSANNLSAALDAYFSQSGRGTTSRSLLDWTLEERRECEGRIVLNW